MSKTKATQSTLPGYAKLPVNHCNLPAEVLGDLSFQSNPKPIVIDGVAELHKKLYLELDSQPNTESRSQLFLQYMKAHFRLDSLDDAGYEINSTVDRPRANYLRVLRGWFFNSDSQEGAVIKAWVESRFGLSPRYHHGPIRSMEDPTYEKFITQRARGLYNTNALEAQLDLLYSFCQYELSRRYPDKKSITLYRGQNNMQSLERLADHQGSDATSVILLLNNISSFTSESARAGEFGDVVIRIEVPFSKLLFFSGLMPGIMTSEREYAVIGGVYAATVVKEAILK